MLDWSNIDTVLLDMDGTLLDLHFDNHFWQAHLPRRWLESQGLPPDAPLDDLVARFQARTGTLEWYSVDFWADELELDIMMLKEEVAHLIAVHPHVPEFLAALRRSGRRVILATNAHHKSVTLKMAKTGLEPHFDAIISSHALGAAKESQVFWEELRKVEAFDPARTLLIDDSLPVLDSARRYGIAHLLAIRKPDSRQPEKQTGDYVALDGFRQIMPT
jgi:putative hydrolase of the HAD superfamily